MTTYANTPDENEEVNTAGNYIAPYGDDTLGENTGDSALDIDAQKNQDMKPTTENPRKTIPGLKLWYRIMIINCAYRKVDQSNLFGA
jgi:hypothetical protein